jgi:hypothetical protein
VSQVSNSSVALMVFMCVIVSDWILDARSIFNEALVNISRLR